MQLKHYLKQRGLTQSEFATLMGVSLTTVNDWCTGKKSPSMLRMIKIKKVTKGKVGPADFMQQKIDRS